MQQVTGKTEQFPDKHRGTLVFTLLPSILSGIFRISNCVMFNIPNHSISKHASLGCTRTVLCEIRLIIRLLQKERGLLKLNFQILTAMSLVLTTPKIVSQILFVEMNILESYWEGYCARNDKIQYLLNPQSVLPSDRR